MLFLSEKFLKKHLHGQKGSRIEKALKSFRADHGFDPELDNRTKELRKRLEAEAVRIYPMVDDSILKERIKRAKVAAVLTAALTLAGVCVAGAVFGMALTAIVLLTPVLSAAVSAIASVSTINISYNARVNGAMNSVKAVYEAELIRNKPKVSEVSAVSNISGAYTKAPSHVDSIANAQGRNL